MKGWERGCLEEEDASINQVSHAKYTWDELSDEDSENTIENAVYLL